MLRRILFLIAFLSAGMGPALAAPRSPVGAWVTASGGAVVQIEQCGNALCGHVSGIVLNPGTPMPVDWQGQPECGLQLLRPSSAGQDGSWHGRIVDPRNGSAYHVEFHVDRQGRLHLRGYLGLPIFGETQIWHRYEGAAPTSCRLTPGQVAEAGLPDDKRLR
ncbi:MAG TPA: DUF2147 domain-containing protein [Acetobacteraceae bacterium]|nr:DUF2147 domain-containing protein [Acetobacteraceae bacterium]